jgi:ADP-ribosylglycohydrolase/predicted enzyme related to lactoylglutathione lyase
MKDNQVRQDENGFLPNLVAKAKGAILGAAVGDALGWPQERPGHQRSAPQPASLEMRPWARRTGTRFYSHVEAIGAGEYSDDTQLILSTFRALLSADDWCSCLATSEIPSWLIYERGGGGATKRAAESWVKELPPWAAKPQERRRYFDAGGNGVAMRILPHAVMAANDADFGGAATRIVANGVLTHGHPLALVGAMAYGYALWLSLRSQETLPYGALISRTLADAAAWTKIPDMKGFVHDWPRAADEHSGGKYNLQWQSAVAEQIELLERAASAMKKGALSLDERTLEELGCLDKRTGAAGTRTAAAAIFLASRFATDPANGLMVAAYAVGTDTDTIASMTGGILGALSGQSWLGLAARQVQDSKYLEDIVESAFARNNVPQQHVAGAPRRRPQLGSLLEGKRVGDRVPLPDGRKAEILKQIHHETASDKTIAMSWKVRCDDGQTLFIKRLGKHQDHPAPDYHDPDLFQRKESNAIPTPSRVGVKVYVQDLPRVRAFYEQVLGLEVWKQSSEFVNFAGTFALIALPVHGASAEAIRQFAKEGTSVIYIETQDPKTIFESVKKLEATIITDLREENRLTCFRCLDPAGNLVEVYRARTNVKNPDTGAKKPSQ